MLLTIAGPQKAGTTSVFRYICNSKNVCGSKVKETDFFTYNYDRKKNWFESLFECDEYSVQCEASPRNLMHPEAPSRIKQEYPDARIVFIFRNPIQRAYSHYWFRVSRGNIQPLRTFSEIIRESNNEVAKRVILEQGLYCKHLCNYLLHFDINQIKILKFDDLNHKKHDFIRSILNFVEIDYENFSLPKEDRYNVTSHPSSFRLYAGLRRLYNNFEPFLGSMPYSDEFKRKIRNLVFSTKERPTISDEDREYLEKFYIEDIRELNSYTEFDTLDWLE